MKSIFRDRLRNREQLVGTWVKTPAPVVCELLGRTNLDVLCLDAEHAPFDRLSLDQCVHALRGEEMPCLIRVPSARNEHILNALDCGATGVVIPHVTNGDVAAAVAVASHFGAGGRGYAGSTRAAGYTTKPMNEHLRDSANESTVIAQIEDIEALDHLDDIAAVDGIDCLFIGRIDLTVALGADSPRAPRVIEAVEDICSAGRAAGRAVGMFLSDPAEIPHWREKGASLFLLSSDHSFLLQGANSLAASFHS